MTLRDVIPFGKYRGTPLGDLPNSYVEWLLDQDWFKEKNATMYKLLDEGESEETTADSERKTLDDEAVLLTPMPDDFKAFWKRSYGERMRVHGAIQYIAFLRVACTTWKEARGEQDFKLQPTEPPKPKPLATYIPQPNLDEDTPF